MAKSFRFIIVPKVSHPWYDEVRQGAQAQADLLSRELGATVAIEFLPPAEADTRAQAAML
jgi:ribose transport system substrate-binding protein